MTAPPAAGLPLFVALPRGADPKPYQPILDKIRSTGISYELAGDVWARVVGAGESDYAGFAAYVGGKGGDGRHRFRGIVLPDRVIGTGTAAIVREALASGLSVVIWEAGRFVRPMRMDAVIEGRTYARAFRAV